MQVISKDNYTVPVISSHPDGEANAIVLIIPAMGVRASFYRGFAKSLASEGILAIVMELRGHGESSQRAGWFTDYGYKEHVDDISAILAVIKVNHPEKLIHLVGHSLGGHFSVLMAGLKPESFESLIMVASGTPWHGAYLDKMAKKTKKLKWIVPLLLMMFGAFPGDKIGFAGREARTLIRDWLNLVNDNRFKIKGLPHDIESIVEGYEGRLLCLSFEDDDLAPLRASELMIAKMPKVRADYRLLSDSDINGKATHFGWARTPQVVAKIIKDWID